MKRSEIKVGEVYAYERGTRDSEYAHPRAVRVVELDREVPRYETFYGRVSTIKNGVDKKIIVVYVDPQPFDAKEFAVKPINLWRTWAEQEVINKAQAEAKAQAAAATKARKREEMAQVYRLRELVPAAALEGIYLVEGGRAHISIEQLITIVEAVRARQSSGKG